MVEPKMPVFKVFGNKNGSFISLGGTFINFLEKMK